jgi:hypothetical protein
MEKNPLPRDPQIFHFYQGSLMNKGPGMGTATGGAYGDGILNRFQDKMKTGFVIPDQMGHFKIWYV